jgi:hypothetical protein
MAAIVLTSCSLLVQFDTQPCDGGSCFDASPDAPVADVTIDTAPGPEAETGGKDSAPEPKDSRLPDDVGGSNDADPCSGKTDGTPWGPLDTDRCCNQTSVSTTDGSNCGGCGIVCSGTQHCGTSPLSDGEYLCLGCVLDTDCWSGHCVPDTVVSDGGATVDAGSHCAVESDDAGDCIDTCPSGTPPPGPPPCCPTGSHCVMPAGVILNYCTYGDGG